MPVWGLGLAFVFLFAAVGIAVPAALSQPERSAAQPRPLPSMYVPEKKAIVTFIGDSYTGGSEMDSGIEARWPNLVSLDLDFTERILARGGSGYVTVGPSEERFGDVVTELNPQSRLVVVYGSINDVATGDEVRDAAVELYRSVQTKAPEAKLLVVGPTWRTEDPPPNIIASDAALASAAEEVGVPFVSTLDAGLLLDPEQIGEDGVHPTDEGHQQLAEFMAPYIAEQLDD